MKGYDRKFTLEISSNERGKFAFVVRDEVRGFRGKSSNHDYGSAIDYASAMCGAFIDNEQRDANQLAEERKHGSRVFAMPIEEKPRRRKAVRS